MSAPTTPSSSLPPRPLLGHLREQGPVIGAMARAAARGLVASRRPAVTGREGEAARALLGHRFHGVARLPSPTLVADFRRFVGDDGPSDPSTVPPHLFPQWTFPLSARVLARTGLPLQRILNAGCSLRVLSPAIERGSTPLDVSVELTEVDDDGARLRMTQTLTMGRGGRPAAIATLSTYLPFPRPRDHQRETPREKRAPALVPSDAQIIDRWSLRGDAGRSFAALTGDVNPIHLSRAAARLAGFRGCILHGFATFARGFEALSRDLRAREEALGFLDLRFVKPLVLPSDIVIATSHEDSVAVGLGAGADAFAVGRFERSLVSESSDTPREGQEKTA